MSESDGVGINDAADFGDSVEDLPITSITRDLISSIHPLDPLNFPYSGKQP